MMHLQYVSTLLANQVKHIAGHYGCGQSIRERMPRTKKAAINNHLLSLDSNTSAGAFLRSMQPFMGPSNPKKRKAKVIPMRKDEHQERCTLESEVVSTWAQFFQEMEGCQRMPYEELRSR